MIGFLKGVGLNHPLLRLVVVIDKAERGQLGGCGGPLLEPLDNFRYFFHGEVSLMCDLAPL